MLLRYLSILPQSINSQKELSLYGLELNLFDGRGLVEQLLKLLVSCFYLIFKGFLLFRWVGVFVVDLEVLEFFQCFLSLCSCFGHLLIILLFRLLFGFQVGLIVDNGFVQGGEGEATLDLQWEACVGAEFWVFEVVEVLLLQHVIDADIVLLVGCINLLLLLVILLGFLFEDCVRDASSVG